MGGEEEKEKERESIQYHVLIYYTCNFFFYFIHFIVLSSLQPLVISAERLLCLEALDMVSIVLKLFLHVH